MPEKNAHRRIQPLSWRIAGFWMVVLALGLAVAGIVLAVVQARSVTHRFIAQTEAGASRIADAAREQFNAQLANALGMVIGRVRGGMEQTWQPSDKLPTWIDGIFSWNGQSAELLAGGASDTQRLKDLVEHHLREEDVSTLGTDAQPRMRYDTLAAEPFALGWMVFADGNGSVTVVAGCVNVSRLLSDLVEPLLSTYEGLELVKAGPTNRPWSQPLYGVMESWTIQPGESFLREQRAEILRETLTFLGLPILALVTLLVAMAVLAKVMRREMALAKMKANFVADVSHELKTPLALIHMFGETLQAGRVTSEEKRQEYYDIITRESTRLTLLINNILDFSRLESGQISYHLEPIDIGTVARETYETYRPQLDHDGFEHHLTVARSLPIVDADRGAISQALINLINNAIKYSGDERYLFIEVTQDTRRDRRGVLISVHDRGIGIKPADRARVIEGFFRSEDERVRDQGGTGLGLALVKKIADAHGGSLDIESRLVKGSTFRVFLPESRSARLP